MGKDLLTYLCLLVTFSIITLSFKIILGTQRNNIFSISVAILLATFLQYSDDVMSKIATVLLGSSTVTLVESLGTSKMLYFFHF